MERGSLSSTHHSDKSLASENHVDEFGFDDAAMKALLDPQDLVLVELPANLLGTVPLPPMEIVERALEGIAEMAALADETLVGNAPDVLGFAAAAPVLATRVVAELARLVEAANAVREAALLLPSQGALEQLHESCSGENALARSYFRDPENVVLLSFHVSALKQFYAGHDALLSTPCGSGKTAPAIMFAVACWEASRRSSFFFFLGIDHLLRGARTP